MQRKTAGGVQVRDFRCGVEAQVEVIETQSGAGSQGKVEPPVECGRVAPDQPPGQVESGRTAGGKLRQVEPESFDLPAIAEDPTIDDRQAVDQFRPFRGGLGRACRWLPAVQPIQVQFGFDQDQADHRALAVDQCRPGQGEIDRGDPQKRFGSSRDAGLKATETQPWVRTEDVVGRGIQCQVQAQFGFGPFEQECGQTFRLEQAADAPGGDGQHGQDDRQCQRPAATTCPVRVRPLAGRHRGDRLRVSRRARPAAGHRRMPVARIRSGHRVSRPCPRTGSESRTAAPGPAARHPWPCRRVW